MTERQDLYPSRQAPQARFLDRQDPVVSSAWTAQAPLSREQVQGYERNGLIAIRDMFSAQEIEALKAEAARIKAGPDALQPETTITEPGADDALRSAFMIHRQNDVFSRLAADERLVRIAEFILGDDVYIHQSRLNFKPGFEGKDFYWHSDFETWHVEDGMPRMRALSMSILLTENTPVNGPTMFMPGSHMRYAACVGETPDDHYRQSLKKQEYGVPSPEALTELARDGVEAPIGPAGTVVIFDSNTMHGSNSNITPMPRWNAFFVYNAASNRLEAPFGPARPRPEFIAARDHAPIIRAAAGSLSTRAA